MVRHGRSGAQRGTSALSWVSKGWWLIAALGLCACGGSSQDAGPEQGVDASPADRAQADPDDRAGAASEETSDGDDGDGPPVLGPGTSDGEPGAMDGMATMGAEPAGEPGSEADGGVLEEEAMEEPPPAVTGIMGGEAIMTAEDVEVILAAPAEAAATLAAALCEGARRCCREAGQGDSGLLDCESSTNPGLDLIQAVGKGFVAVDAEVLEACTAQASDSDLDCAGRLPELGPFGFLVALPACEGLLYGVVPLGGSCSSDEMCQQGEQPVRCVPDVRLGRVCQAVPVGEAGDPCLVTSSPLGDSYVQQEGGAGGAECRAEAGLFCDEQADGAYACTPVKALGAACESHMECAVDAYCDGTCSALSADGQACTASRQCVSQQCDSTLHCSPRIAPQGVVCRDPLAQ